MAHTIKDTGQSIVPATRFLDLSNEVQTITYDYCFSGLQVTLSEAYDEKIHTYKSTLIAPRNSTALLLVSRHIYELAKTRLLQNYEVFAHSFCDVGHGHFDVVLMVPVLLAWNVLWPSLQWGSALYLPALKSYFPNLKRLTLKVDHIFWLQSSSSTSEINPLVAKDLCFESLGRVLEDKKIREEVLYDHGLVMEALYDHGLVMEALCDCPGVRVFYLLPVEIGSKTYGSERWEEAVLDVQKDMVYMRIRGSHMGQSVALTYRFEQIQEQAKRQTYRMVEFADGGRVPILEDEE